MIVNHRMVAIALLMVAGAGLAVFLTPTQRIADTRGNTDLERMIPKQIGKWTVDASIVPLEPSPEVKEKLDTIYNQTLSLTYVTRAGHRMMLLVAYGGDQSDGMRVHFPEVCYAAQGFEVSKVATGTLITRYGELPVKRLLASQGSRNEPITYWVVVGEKAVTSGTRQKFAQLNYGLAGKVPDGFLVRVSSIDRDGQHAYELQEEFISSMLDAMSDEDRARIAGRFGT